MQPIVFFSALLLLVQKRRFIKWKLARRLSPIGDVNEAKNLLLFSYLTFFLENDIIKQKALFCTTDFYFCWCYHHHRWSFCFHFHLSPKDTIFTIALPQQLRTFFSSFMNEFLGFCKVPPSPLKRKIICCVKGKNCHEVKRLSKRKSTGFWNEISPKKSKEFYNLV